MQVFQESRLMLRRRYGGNLYWDHDHSSSLCLGSNVNSTAQPVLLWRRFRIERLKRAICEWALSIHLTS